LYGAGIIEEAEEMEDPHEVTISANKDTIVALSDISRKVEFPLVLDGKAAVAKGPPGREVL
jgi:hypothetical protein